jgi:uncharacterized protein with NRDE domain
MCLVAVLWRVVPDAPLIVAANRDEAYGRPGTPPQLVAGDTRFVGGLDPKAGGTWLGVNEHRVLIAVTNGPKSHPPSAARSRGLLVRDLLASRTASAAAQSAARELDTKRYAGCNLVCADEESLHVIHAGDWLRLLPLPPGVHVLTTGLINNAADRRIAYTMNWLHTQTESSARGWVPKLQQLCGLPGDGVFPPMCIRNHDGGTLSSSIVVLGNDLAHSGYWHAQGPPDETPYEDVSQLLQQMS